MLRKHKLLLVINAMTMLAALLLAIHFSQALPPFSESVEMQLTPVTDVTSQR